MKRLKTSSPLLCSVLIVIIFFGVMMLASMVLLYAAPSLFYENEYIVQGIAEAVAALSSVGCVALFGYWKIWREKRMSFGKGLVVGLYFIFVSAYSLITLSLSAFLDGVQPQPLWMFFLFTAVMFLVGFTEEVFFRGVVSNMFFDKYAKDSAGVWSAVIVSGLVFGLMHMMNAIGGIALGSIIVQSVVASAMGMALTAIYYRTRNIWVNIFLHAFVDFCSLFVSACLGQDSLSGSIGTYTYIQFIGVVPYLIVTLVLLRKPKMQEILQIEDISPAPQSRKRLLLVVISAVILGVALIGAYFLV